MNLNMFVLSLLITTCSATTVTGKSYDSSLAYFTKQYRTICECRRFCNEDANCIAYGGFQRNSTVKCHFWNDAASLQLQSIQNGFHGLPSQFCEYKGNVYSNGSVVESDECYTKLCVDGEVIGTSFEDLKQSIPRATSCPSDYDSTPSGCYKFVSTQATLCDARKTCIEDGTDITVLEDVSNFLLDMSSYFPSDSIWTGMRGTSDGGYLWLATGGSFNAPYFLYPWQSSQPNAGAGVQQCIRLAPYSGVHHLTDVSCSLTFGYVCEV